MAQAREEAGDSLVSAREASRIIRVSVKTSRDCQEFVLGENSSVHYFKKQISKRLHCDTDRLVLIFTGKILRDQDILSQRGILDGTTVYLVVRTHLKGTLSSPGSLSSPGTLPDPVGNCTHRSEPSTSEGAGMVARLVWLARSSSDLADFFGQLAQLLVAAPQAVVQFLEDPLVQGLASDKPANTNHVPESSKPVQKPEPALKAMETLQNPAKQQEVLQVDKRGLEALKAVPGGDNAMRPICSDIQQLMLFSLAPLVAPRGHNPGSGLCRGEANAHSSTDTTTASVPVRPLAQEVRAGVIAQTPSMASTQANSGCRTGMPDSYSGQDSSSQGGQQPTVKATLSSQLRPSPSALRRALHVLQQNPALLHQLATGSPLRHHIPLLPILTNPRALQALVQIEKGMQILSSEAPGLGPCLWGPGRPHGATGAPESRGAEQGHRTDPVQPTRAVLQLLHALANACSQSTQTSLSSTLPTESRYQQELEHLKAMGFANRDANMQALMATSGDIHAAIERLLGEPEA